MWGAAGPSKLVGAVSVSSNSSNSSKRAVTAVSSSIRPTSFQKSSNIEKLLGCPTNLPPALPPVTKAQDALTQGLFATQLAVLADTGSRTGGHCCCCWPNQARLRCPASCRHAATSRTSPSYSSTHPLLACTHDPGPHHPASRTSARVQWS